MSIEEDSCREVNDIGHERVYLTDRLGMPLIETVTEPAMRTPQEVVEVAWICINLVRSTKRVRRGMCAAREDVNVSVEGGTRIEIKGVPKISEIPLLTYSEAMRQWNLLRLREELKQRGIDTESFNAEVFDITSIIKNPHYQPIVDAIESNLKISCVVVKGFAGLLNWQTQTGTYFSREISDRVRVIACLTKIPNIIHSDIKGDTITSSDWQKVKKFANAADDDTMVIFWGSEDDVKTASDEIIIRAREATIGIPSETRQALSDGTNGFERILPSADRMYPDTDLPPQNITQERLDKIITWLPEKYWERQTWYKTLGIPVDVIDELSISQYAKLFKKAAEEWKVNPTTAAIVLIQYPKRLNKEGRDVGILNNEVLEMILKSYADNELPRDAFLSVMRNTIEMGLFSDEIIPKLISKKQLDIEIKLAYKEIKKIKLRREENKEYVLMGALMRELRGRISAVIVADKVGFKKKSKAND